MKFDIDQPASELTEGYLTLALKYVTLFIVGWLGGWLFLLFIASGRRNHSPAVADILFDNTEYASIFIAIAVIYFFGQRAYRKYRLGLLTSIDFDEHFVAIHLTNTLNGKCTPRKINYSDLSVKMQSKEDSFQGKMRIIEIFEKGQIVTRLNVDLTAWCRNPQVDKMISRLIQY
jgi:hypothetical protein